MKNNNEKKMVQNLKWATAHLSIGWVGAGRSKARGARHRAGSTAQGHRDWRRGPRADGPAGAAGARTWQARGRGRRAGAAGPWALGRAGHGAVTRPAGLPGQGLGAPGRAAGPTGCALGALS